MSSAKSFSSRLDAALLRRAVRTDAVGSSTYNKNLSDRRAAAVRNFLTSEHGIAGERLIVVGVGENQLLNPSQPASPENRRVEVGNLGHQSASLQ